MRHQNSGRKLKRTSSHRKATLAALCTALIVHKRIKTTVAKAKETRMFVEKIITRAKNAVATESAPERKMFRHDVKYLQLCGVKRQCRHCSRTLHRKLLHVQADTRELLNSADD